MSELSITIDFPAKHSRLTTFFRLLLAIPLAIFAYVYEICALIALLVAWVVMVITGRYVEGIYAFESGFVRFYLRYLSYVILAVDAYPPFGGGEDAAYPVQVTIPPRQDKYSRLKAFFRIIYIIPAYLIVAVLGIGLYLLVILAWFIILITGRLPGFIADYMQFVLGWELKLQGLLLLLAENY